MVSHMVFGPWVFERLAWCVLYRPSVPQNIVATGGSKTPTSRYGRLWSVGMSDERHDEGVRRLLAMDCT